MRHPPARLHICLFVGDKCVWKWCTWWHYTWYVAAAFWRKLGLTWVRCSWGLCGELAGWCFWSTLKTGSCGLTPKELVQLSRNSRRHARALWRWFVRREVVDSWTTWQATVRWTLRRPERRLPWRLQDDLADDFEVDFKTTLRTTFRSFTRRPGRRLPSSLIIALARRSHNKSATWNMKQMQLKMRVI